jgi:nitroreductase
MAFYAPVPLAVISRLQENDEVPKIEQRASAGAALGYAVLAADLLGYGAMAVSGRKIATLQRR